MVCIINSLKSWFRNVIGRVQGLEVGKFQFTFTVTGDALRWRTVIPVNYPS